VKTDMPDDLNITVVLGTRPEAIKLCPLISAIRAHDRMRARVCVTGQHREMLDQVMAVFGVAADVDLDLMRRDQSLAELTARAVTALAGEFAEHHADLVLVQGDTTTVFCAALAAYYHRISVGHVEAGLRTGDRYAPFPEELNRRLTTHLGDLHFAPTAGARARLLAEGIPNEAIHVTGNTVIDALHFAVARIREQAPRVPGLPHDLQPGESGRRSVLITGHRRENFGAGFESICQAVAALADRHADCAFVYPVHLNPHVREPVFRLLGKCPNVHLIEPLDYLTFVALLDRATLVLTDSGGVQEEAPSLGETGIGHARHDGAPGSGGRRHSPVGGDGFAAHRRRNFTAARRCGSVHGDGSHGESVWRRSRLRADRRASGANLRADRTAGDDGFLMGPSAIVLHRESSR
jgi:UDP-N-acetylglucosamine 2-epimerase (non-hydrolysing)